MKNIPFNIPLVTGKEEEYLRDAISRKQFCGGGYYNNLCEIELERLTGSPKVLVTSSCTHALEMCALLLDIKEGDEIIMSPFNFVSAANAFVLRGAKIVFVDIRLDTLNIDEKQIEDAITQNTKAILAMHYGGVPCEMDSILSLAHKYGIKVIEDAAHCIGSYYEGKHLGSIGDLGTLSFHSTKNIQCGEGGALMINNEEYIERAEIIREKGTNRKSFIEGKVDKYSWVDLGSSYLASELNCAFLYPQIMLAEEVVSDRISKARIYAEDISSNDLFRKAKYIGNGHIYYLLFEFKQDRSNMMKKLKSSGISAYFHYVPLHLSKAGKKYSESKSVLNNTIEVSKKLLRLPMNSSISPEEQKYVAEIIDR